MGEESKERRKMAITFITKLNHFRLLFFPFVFFFTWIKQTSIYVFCGKLLLKKFQK